MDAVITAARGGYSMGKAQKRSRWAGLDAHRPRPWKETTKCIFCGVEGSQTPEQQLTQEHVFSNWTRRFVPRTMKKFNSLRATSLPDKTLFILVKRAGDVRDWQVRCVCRSCNGGWMRQKVDEIAKPILLPLIKGEATRLSPEEQRVVATWAVLKAMVAEYAESEVVTTSHMQRKRMMNKQLPPEKGWSVWIAHYERTSWPVCWAATPFLVLPDHVAAKRASRRATHYNSHVSTQVIGELFIQVIRSPMPGFAARKWKFHLPARQALFRIWPPATTSIVWPTGTISDHTADYIVGAVKEFLVSTQAAAKPAP